jgi:hypothetical protein
MARDKFKDVKIGDEQFHIGVVPADKGNWAVMMLAGGKSEDPIIFQKIQDLLLSNIQVFRGKEGVSVPMRMYDPARRDDAGNPDPWLVKDLEVAADVDLFNQLILEATGFNFDPFFERVKKEAKEERAKVSTTSQ